MQKLGQATQLLFVSTYPDEGQVKTHEVLSRRYPETHVLQENAPLRQVEQGLTQVVQIP